jgi:hypothetical protein
MQIFDPKNLASQQLQEKRRRFLRRRCQSVIVNETLYHGSPLEGLTEIVRTKKLEPQPHGELNVDAFCVSPNDNMLKFYGVEHCDEKWSGIAFQPVHLNCVKLDWFHYHLISEYKHQPTKEEWSTRDQDEIIADRLGYWNPDRHEMDIDPDDFLDILPPNTDALIFPWQKFERYHNPFLPTEVKVYWPDWNTEAEVSILEPGCKKLWKAIDQIAIHEEWHDKSRALRKIRKLAEKQEALFEKAS